MHKIRKMRKIICFIFAIGLGSVLVSGQGSDIDLESLLNELFTSTQGTNAGLNPTTQRSVVPPATFRPIQPASQPSPQPQPLTPTNTGGGQSTNNNCAGECVPYYLCANNSIITDGAGLIDIRIDDDGSSLACQDYLQTCCAAPDKLPEPELPKIVQPEGCGVRNVFGAGMRISGGSENEAEFGEFPWMVAILKEETGLGQVLNVYQCGGSIIHEQVILTAAHCVAGKEGSAMKVRAGEWDTQTKNEIFVHQEKDVESILIHPQYTKGNLQNDVALLFLREPMKFDYHISPVCLPPQNANFDGSRCYASGWGKDVFGKEGKYQVILKKIDLPVVPHGRCQTAMRNTRLGPRFRLSDTFICAGGEPNKDTCKGDGGSPLVCPIVGTNDRYYQAGMVAWGIGCGEDQLPGAYVNVPKYRNWIDTQMRNRNLRTDQYNFRL